jgi:phage tail-like protein
LALEPGDLPEILIQSGPGRHLWVKVEMSGDGTVSPSVSEMDIFGPRRSAMRHLPASFHQDPESVRFLERFLGYFDTVFAEVIAANREIGAFLDPEVVPAEFLSWLGSWFDLAFLAAWPEATRRAMIRDAIGHFRRRGTVAGLKRILQWHTGIADPLPQVIEHFRLPTGGDPIMVGGTALDPGTPAHSFTIVMPTHLAEDEESRAVLERLIAANVPAHTRWQLRLTEPGVSLGAQSTLGVDMLLAAHGGGALGTGRLGLGLATGGLSPEALVHLPFNVPSRPGEGAPTC